MDCERMNWGGLEMVEEEHFQKTLSKRDLTVEHKLAAYTEENWILKNGNNEL